jgi:hypothetical protein
MYYSHKKFLVQVEIAETDGYLDFGETVQPYFKGNLIATDEHGNQSILPENYFQDHYISVQKVESKPKKKKMSIEAQEAFMNGLMEYGSLPNNVECEDYIKGQMELSKNKAF